MPPISVTSFCSGKISITGNGVSGLISAEFAPFIPSTCLANSIIAICIPRQMPRYGIPCVLAYWQALILPSIPLLPKPPGTSIPSTLPKISSRLTSSPSNVSESIQSMSTALLVSIPPCFNASFTEMYESWSSTYLPTIAILTVCFGFLSA